MDNNQLSRLIELSKEHNITDLSEVVDLTNIGVPKILTEPTKYNKDGVINVSLYDSTASWMKVSKLQALQMLVSIEGMEQSLKKFKTTLVDKIEK